MIALLLLGIAPTFRRRMYEAFFRTHIALSPSLLGMLLYHARHIDRFSEILLGGTLVCFTTSLLYWSIHQIYRNAVFDQFTIGKVSLIEQDPTDKNSLTIALDLTRPCHIEPGQYVYLKILTKAANSIFQSHPFVVAWWDAREEDFATRRIYVMIDPQSGWTRHIMSLPDQFVAKSIWLDGPYGRPLHAHEYGTVLLFASGFGIFAILPVLKRLIELSKVGAAKTRRIKLVWYTDKLYTRLQGWMQEFLNDDELDIHVHASSHDSKPFSLMPP